MSGPVRLEGVVSDLPRERSLGVIRGDDMREYRYSAAEVFPFGVPLVRQGLRVDFQPFIESSWSGIATFINVTAGLVVLPVDHNGVDSLGEERAGHDHSRVIETSRDAALVAISRLRSMARQRAPERRGPLCWSPKLLTSCSKGDVRWVSTRSVRPCPSVALNDALVALSREIGLSAWHRDQFLIPPVLLPFSHVAIDPADGLVVRVVQYPSWFDFDVAIVKR